MRARLLLVTAAALLGCSADDPGTALDGGGLAGDGGNVMTGDGGGSVFPGDDSGTVVVNPGDPIPGDPTVPVAIDNCTPGMAGAPDKATIDQLLAGGTPGGRLLYPYDGTVFPRGLAGPTLMWEGAGTSAAYVHITGPNFEYKGCRAITGPSQFQIPPDVWEAAGTKTRGKQSPFKVELFVQTGGKVVGPLTSQWTIAQATIKGSIYYNSYMSLKGIPGLGKVLRIQPGKEAEAFIQDGCNGCHSVSANGKRLSSMTLLLQGMSFDISSGTPRRVATPVRSAYPAMTPDGLKSVIGSAAMDVARSNWTSPGGGGIANATLMSTDTGMAIASTGLPPGALMPSFSSDGKLMVYTDAQTQATTIGAVDFDGNSTFSNPRVLFTDTNLKPGWPFLLPDNKAVVFVRTTPLNDWSANGAGALAGLAVEIGPYSELFMVDVATKKSTILAKAMGYLTEADATAKKSYLPFPNNHDLQRAYFPTVSPVAAGGYFWVFFDAVRHYGNMGLGRQLWGTAVEISPNGDYTIDRSAPAFYVPGQEWGTGNHRAFTALDACKMDGDTCTSGVDCCGGYCTITPQEIGTPVGTCSSTAQCAKTDERCTTSADCCPLPGQPANSCIAGFCAQVPILL